MTVRADVETALVVILNVRGMGQTVCSSPGVKWLGIERQLN